MTSEEKLRRDASVVADRARGFSWSTVAGRNDLCERMCRSIWNDYLRDLPLGPDNPKEAILEAAAQWDAAIEDLAALAESTANDPVRLGAIKSRVEAMARKQDLLRLAGILPYSPQAMRTENELQRATDTIIELFARVVPEPLQVEAARELVATLNAA